MVSPTRGAQINTAEVIRIPEFQDRAVFQRRTTLQQSLELVDSETGIADDASHRIGIDRIVPGNCEYSLSVSHYGVLTLPSDTKSRFLERAYSDLVVYSGQSRHWLY